MTRFAAGELLAAVVFAAWCGWLAAGTASTPVAVAVGLAVLAVPLGSAYLLRGGTGGGRPTVEWRVHPSTVAVLAFGVVLAGALAVVLAPGRLSGPLGSAVVDPLLGVSDRAYVVVQAAGVLGVVATIVLGVHAARGRSAASPPVGERSGGVESDRTTARADLADAVERFHESAGRGSHGWSGEHSERIRTALREAATSVLVRTEDWSAETARRRLAAGDWTDDPRARSVLSDRSPSLAVRLLDWVRFEPTSVRRATAVVDELERALADHGAVVDTGLEGNDGRDGDPASHSGADRDPPERGDRSADPSGTGPAGSGDERSPATDGLVSASDPIAASTTVDFAALEPDADAADDADDGRDDSAGANGDPSGNDPDAGEDSEGNALRDGGDREGSTLRGRARAVRSHDVGATAGAFALAGGYLARSEAMLVMGAMALVYAGVAYLTRCPDPTLRVSRSVSDAHPLPGDVVEVELEVENVGDRTVTDLRVVDGVPDPLTVVEGTPALGAALRPGETLTHTYALRARRGAFAFDPVDVMVRDLASTRESHCSVPVETPVRCSTLLDEFPMATPAGEQVGGVVADEGGNGVEFYATREYREGDPVNRVDWNRLAKTGDLTTIQFRERRDATVVLCIDAREACRVAPTETDLGAVDAAVYAAERTFLAVDEEGIDVGVLTVGDGLADLRPGSGSVQRARVQGLLRDETDRYDTIEADGGRRTVDPDTNDATDVATVRDHLPSRSQVVVFSPFVDDYPLELTRQIRAAGHPVTVVSPDAVGEATVSQRVVGLERAVRLRAVGDAGATVLDWSFGEPIQSAVVRAIRRGVSV